MTNRSCNAVKVVIGRSCRRLWRCAVFAAGFYLPMLGSVICGQTIGADVRVAQTAPGQWQSPRASIQAPQPRPRQQSGHSGIQPVQFQTAGSAETFFRPASSSSRPFAPGVGAVYSEWRRDSRPATTTMRPAASVPTAGFAQSMSPQQGRAQQALTPQTTIPQHGFPTASFQTISSASPQLSADHSNDPSQIQRSQQQQRIFEPQTAASSATHSDRSTTPPIHVYPPGFAARQLDNTIQAPRLKPIPQTAESAIPLLPPPGSTDRPSANGVSVPPTVQAPSSHASGSVGQNINHLQTPSNANLSSHPGGWTLPHVGSRSLAPAGSYTNAAAHNPPVAPVHVYPDGVTPQDPSDTQQRSAASVSSTQRPLHVYPDHQSAALTLRQQEAEHLSFDTHSVQQHPATDEHHPVPVQARVQDRLAPGAGHSLDPAAAAKLKPERQQPLNPERYRPPTVIRPASQQPASQSPKIIQQASAETSADSKIFWWEQDLPRQLLRGREPYTLSLPQALGLALTEAPELQILHSDWFIQQIEVTRRDGQFDWTTFVDSIWNRDSTPVGSNLDGAAERLRSRSLNAAAGIRRLGRDGTELEIFQRFGLLGSNSQFINPNNQGTTRLGFNYEKPLMRGSGTEYNEGPVRLAQIDNDIAFDQFQIGIQDHLLAVSSAYWSLVLQRGLFLQSVASWTRARQIAEEMAGRVEIDVTPNMLDRARSEVAERLAASIQAEHDTVQAQDALLRLIFGSRYTQFASREIVTLTLPMTEADSVAPEPQIQTALHQRSEVHGAIRQIKAASLRYNLAANEVMPMLNLVLTGYAAGLERNSNLGQSFLNQFDRGEPGVGVGINFELPYRNRAAQAAAEQNLIAIKRMKAQLELTIGEVTEDVREQVIQRNKYGAMLTQQWESLARAKRILKYAETRRSVLADGTAVADLYLENLLLMQNRLADAEQAYLQSQVLFSLADNGLLRAISQLDSLAQREPKPAAQHFMPQPEFQHFPMEQQPMEQQPMEQQPMEQQPMEQQPVERHSTQQPMLMIP